MRRKSPKSRRGSRTRRLELVLTCVVMLSLVPLPEQLPRWLATNGFNLVRTAHAAQPDLSLPSLFQPSPKSAPHPQIASAWPKDTSPLMRPGANPFGTAAESRPAFTLDDPSGKGPGIKAVLEQPGSPSVSADLRIKGLGGGLGSGRSGRQEGRAVVIEIPADGSATSVPPPPAPLGGSSPAPTLPSPSPVAAPPTATPVQAAPRAPFIAAAASPSPSPAITPTATSTPGPGQPSYGNRYNTRLTLKYTPNVEGTAMKESIVLYSKPATNIVEYSLDLRGLSAGPVKADGSIDLLDHANKPLFSIPPPTIRDARGGSGTASYRYTPPTGGGGEGKLELVLDAAWLSGAAYPIEIDPGIVTAAGLVENVGAPWQRQAVTATDGTFAYGFYDTTSGSTGIKLATSTDNWTSVANTTTIAAGLGAGGFSLEIDQNTDKILVGLTGASGGTNFLRIIPLAYNATTKVWSPGTAMDVQSSATLSWSGASLVIERGTTDYVWVGADERDTANKYTYRSHYATLASVLAGTPTWTTLSPAFPALTTYVHFTGLVAVTGGIAAVGRDGNFQKGAVYTRSTNTWGALATLGGRAFPDAKEFALLAVADPLSPGATSLVPMAALPPDDGDTNRNAIKLYVRRYGSTTWTGVNLPGVVSADAQPALSTADGGPASTSGGSRRTAPLIGRSTGIRGAWRPTRPPLRPSRSARTASGSSRPSTKTSRRSTCRARWGPR